LKKDFTSHRTHCHPVDHVVSLAIIVPLIYRDGYHLTKTKGWKDLKPWDCPATIADRKGGQQVRDGWLAPRCTNC
jgi:hypothetical protein